ncbi:hypothetical protein P153DRAFT_140187 [Dothidotthia symphoricarpi CBS 119687]|uniref:Uncharacterized protein n=1 Tax=Dothidotthia symphoricarpi CBS 119687 TaxID=1392245 RepID=A0A6A5ZYI9_9PLEO|nr:uncharacterized protein P153DRAFT_140187 [Dothidotthia symphoricarpi CBS 119687]KAF2123847.1 hypothetical protein P153DRAFT_140187 [Dothidotthia symphoricarpi CBS 119687]
MQDSSRAMIVPKRVSELLTKNVNEQLYPRLFLMTPHGMLMGYSTPVDIKELRDQAAVVSMLWNDTRNGRQTDERKDSIQPQAGAIPSPKPALETLTIETEYCNIIARALQPELLLVLVGNIAPHKKQSFKITAEEVGNQRYPAAESSEGHAAVTSGNGIGKGKAPSLLSNMSQRDKDIRLGALHIQRKKLDALADYIVDDFKATGFVQPPDSSLN